MIMMMIIIIGLTTVTEEEVSQGFPGERRSWAGTCSSSIPRAQEVYAMAGARRLRHCKALAMQYSRTEGGSTC